MFGFRYHVSYIFREAYVKCKSKPYFSATVTLCGVVFCAQFAIYCIAKHLLTDCSDRIVWMRSFCAQLRCNSVYILTDTSRTPNNDLQIYAQFDVITERF